MEASQASNIAVASNVWIDADNPGGTALWQVQREIPGDLMIDFIAKQNPLVNPRDTQIIKAYLTPAQIREYKTRRFFLNQGEDGAAFEPSY